MTEDMQRLQTIEQAMHSLTVQLQSQNSRLDEFKSALDALEGSDTNYKILGNIMVKASSEDLKKELLQKQEAVQQHIKGLEQQRDTFKKEMEKLQKAALGDDDE